MASELPATSEILLPTDASKQILDTFLGQGWDTWGAGLGGSQASELMLQIFSAFNLVALAVISALFLWVMALAVAGTAHEGTPFGKRFSSLWMPLRFVGAMGALAPIFKGLSLFQVAILACIGFSMLFNIHGAGMLICAGGGALGWLCYLLTGPLVGNDIIQSFFAALVISAWSEVMARLRKCPVTSYLLVALFPLVPGGGIYYTMEHALNGDTELFLDTLMHTLGLAGALAVGVLLVASVVRLFTTYQSRRRG